MIIAAALKWKSFCSVPPLSWWFVSVLNLCSCSCGLRFPFLIIFLFKVVWFVLIDYTGSHTTHVCTLVTHLSCLLRTSPSPLFVHLLSLMNAALSHSCQLVLVEGSISECLRQKLTSGDSLNIHPNCYVKSVVIYQEVLRFPAPEFRRDGNVVEAFPKCEARRWQ